MKKALKIILIIILIGGFAWFLWWLMRPDGTPSQNQFITSVREFFPFGETSQDETTPDTFPGEDTFFEDGQDTSELRREDADLPNHERVYEKPAAGYTIIGTSTPIVRVVDRANGHIIDINTQTKNRTRISNTTLPRIREALWFNEGRSVILRFIQENSLDTIETLLITNIFADGENIGGTYLEEGIVSLNPISNSEIAYMVDEGFGSAIRVYNINSGTSETITTSPIKSWHILSGSRNRLYIQTKASYSSPGHTYRLNRNTGALEKVVNPYRGITGILSPDNSHGFFTTGGTESFSFIYNLTSGELTLTELNTIAEKCVFGSDTSIYCGIPSRSTAQDLPDSWYMGRISFNDHIWHINSEDGSYQFVTALSEEEVDVIKPQLSDNMQNFFFVDKQTGFVWIVRLSQILASEEAVS